MISTVAQLARLGHAGFIFAREGVFALIDTTRLPLPAHRPVDVRSILDRIVDLYDAEPGVTIRTRVEDGLPRRIKASFFEEGGAFRHTVELSNWQLDLETSPDDFASAKALAAGRIPFSPPGTK